MANTTNKIELLDDLIPIHHGPKLRVADSRAHVPTHLGYLYVSDASAKGYFPVKCYYTPTLPATILLLSAITQQ